MKAARVMNSCERRYNKSSSCIDLMPLTTLEALRSAKPEPTVREDPSETSHASVA